MAEYMIALKTYHRCIAFALLCSLALVAVAATQSLAKTSEDSEFPTYPAGDVIWLDQSPTIHPIRGFSCGTGRSPFRSLGLFINQDGEILQSFNKRVGATDSASLFHFSYRQPVQVARYIQPAKHPVSTREFFYPFPSDAYLIDSEGKVRAFAGTVRQISPGWHGCTVLRYPRFAKHLKDRSKLTQQAVIEPGGRANRSLTYANQNQGDQPILIWANEDYMLIRDPDSSTRSGHIVNRRTGDKSALTFGNIQSAPHFYERTGRLIANNFDYDSAYLYDPSTDQVLFDCAQIYPSSHHELMIARVNTGSTSHVVIDRDGNVLEEFDTPNAKYHLEDLTGSGIALWVDYSLSRSISEAEQINRTADETCSRERLSIDDLALIRPTQNPERFVRGSADFKNKALLDESLNVVFDIPFDEHPIYVTQEAKLVTYDEPEHAYVLYSPEGDELKRFDMLKLGYPFAPARR